MATTNSTQYARALASATTKNSADEYNGRLAPFYFLATQSGAGAAGDDFNLVFLPPGLWRVLLPLSYVQWDAMSGSRVMDIGYRAYTDINGAAVAADLNYFDDDIDVSSAGQAAMGSDVAVGTGRTVEFESRTGVVIVATVTGGTIADAVKLSGFVAAVPGN